MQIWCLLSNKEHIKEVSSLPGKKEKNPKKDTGTKKPKKDTCTNDNSTEIKKPRGRPRKNPSEKNEEIVPITNKRKRGGLEISPAPNENLENNEEMHPITNKRKRRRSIKYPTVIDIPSGTVQFEENSIESPAPNGNNENNEETPCITYKSKKWPIENKTLKEKPSPIKGPRGRPKKSSKEVTASDPNFEDQFVPLTVECPDSAKFISNTKEKNAKKVASACDSETPVTRSRLDINHMERSCSQDASRPLLNQCEEEEDHQSHGSSVLEPQESTCPIPQNVALPKFVSCLAHNGKVAWDVKWRPLNNIDSSCNHRMGYLAVLLGNGSLEV